MTQSAHAPDAASSRLDHRDLMLLLLGTLCLLWPAMWNGMPLFFYDSIDYIRGSFTFEPAVYRTLPYSVFLTFAHAGLSLWIAIAVQALIVTYLLLEICHALVPTAPRRAFLISLPIVILGTGIPWFASQIMPDALTAPMVMGLALIGMARLPPLRMFLVVLLTLVAIPAHASHFGTALAMVIGLGLLAWISRAGFRVRILAPLIIVVAGILITPAIHKVATGEFYVSRSAPIMAFARLIRDGEAQRYMAESCDERHWRLCPYLHLLKPGWDGANEFLWQRGSPFHTVGGWKDWRGNGQEARAMVLGAVLAHPGDNLYLALRAWGQQLITFGTGSGLEGPVWWVAPLRTTMETYFPLDVPPIPTSRQWLETVDLGGLSAAHQGVIGAATLAGLFLLWRLRRKIDPSWGFLALVLLAGITNSGVTAIFSNPDDRYQARLVWLLIPAVICLLAARRWGAPLEPSQPPLPLRMPEYAPRSAQVGLAVAPPDRLWVLGRATTRAGE